MSQFFVNPGSFPGNILNQVLNPNPGGATGGINPTLDPSTLPTFNPFPSVKNGGGLSLPNIGSTILQGAEDALSYLDKKINDTAREDTTLYPVIVGFAHVVFEDGTTKDLAFPITEMVVDIKGHKEADGLDMTWNYNDMPYDPRLVKTLICSMWVGYEDSLLSPTTSQQAMAVFQKGKLQCMFEGYADEYKIEWKPDGGYESKAICRDYTALLIDTKVAEGDFPTIRGTDKFTDIVKKLATPFGFKVVFSEGLEAKCPTVQKYFADKDHRLVEEHTSYWDVICKMGEMIGAVAFVWQRTLYFGAPDPFAVFKTIHGETATHIQYMWGTNIQELDIRRKYNTNYQYTNVEVRGFDIKTGKPIYVTWPDPPVQRDIRMVGGSFSSEVVHGKPGQGPLPQYATKAQLKNIQVPIYDSKGRVVRDTNGKIVTKTQTQISKTVTQATDGKGGGNVSSNTENEKREQQNYIVYAPLYCKDVTILKEIAKQAWNNLHKMEIEGRMKVQGHSDMVSGMAFQITMSPTHIKLLQTYPNEQDRIAALIKRGYDPGLAAAVAKFIADEDTRWWYVLGAKHRYSDGDGYSCEVDFISFVNFEAIKKGENTPQQSASKPGGTSSGRGATPTNPAKPRGRNNNTTPTIQTLGNIPAAIQKTILNAAAIPNSQGNNFLPLNGQ